MISMSSYFTVIGLVPTKRLRWGGYHHDVMGQLYSEVGRYLFHDALLISQNDTTAVLVAVFDPTGLCIEHQKGWLHSLADSAETRDSSYLPQNKAKTSRETQSSRLLPMSATGAGTAGRRRVCRRTSCRVFRQTSAAATTTSSSSTSSNKCERVGGNQSWYNLPPRIHHCGWMNAWMEPPAIPRHNSSGRHAGSPARRATLQCIC